MTGVKRKVRSDLDIHAFHKELDEVLCPICMDHPHNAVLLRCSSHEKGCRSYICDTSYRHSNCLDRFKNLTQGTSNEPNSGAGLNVMDASDNNYSVYDNTYSVSSRLVGEPTVSSSHDILGNAGSTRGSLPIEEAVMGSSLKIGLSLKCPLCRGAVLEFEVVEEARAYLNLKKRSCSMASCSFSGDYRHLRIHARTDHPTTRPSDVDPSRERAWRRLQRQSDFGDAVSAIRSAIPGAVVMGDYAIEDRFSDESEYGPTEDNADPWLALFLLEMIASYDDEWRSWTRVRTRNSRPPRDLPEHRFLWGENLLGLQNEDDDFHISIDVGEDDYPIPRRYRRLTRSRLSS